MKRYTKIFNIALLVAALLISCGKKANQNNHYSIVGEMDESISTQWAYMQDILTGTVMDSTEVVAGSYQFEGTVDTPFIAIVNLDHNPMLTWQVIVEPGEIHLNIESPIGSGTPQNDGLRDWTDQLNTIGNPKELNEFFCTHWDEHSQDLVGPFVLSNLATYMDFAFVDSLMQNVPTSIKANPLIALFINQLDVERNMQPGSHYVDIELITLDGEPCHLSEYVGQGKYTLVDFWASWCGPCCRAIPEVQNSIKKYKDLQVLGIAIRDKEDDTRKAIKQLNITWPVICDPEVSTSAIYGFNSIPFMLLFDPKGQLVERGFNHTQLDELLSTIFQTQ